MGVHGKQPRNATDLAFGDVPLPYRPVPYVLENSFHVQHWPRRCLYLEAFTSYLGSKLTILKNIKNQHIWPFEENHLGSTLHTIHFQTALFTDNVCLYLELLKNVLCAKMRTGRIVFCFDRCSARCPTAPANHCAKSWEGNAYTRVSYEICLCHLA